MDLVSGGDIIVIGQRPSSPIVDDGAWVYQMERANFESEMRRSIQYVDGYSVTVDIGEPVPSDAELVDTDEDGVPDTPEIIATAEKMTEDQRNAYDYHRYVATLVVNGIYYGLLARLGYSGYAGTAGAAGAVGTQALSDAREQMIDSNAELNYKRDGADGSYDGDIDPGYITGDKSLP